MNLIEKNLLVVTLLLCGNTSVLNAQFSISEFLDEHSYIEGVVPVDESLVSYHIESPFDYDDSPYRLRSDAISPDDAPFDPMGGDTPDPGDTVPVPVGNACWCWMIMAALYSLKIFRQRKFTLLSVLLSFPLHSFSGGEYSFSLAADPRAAYLYGDVAGTGKVSVSFNDLKLKHIRYMFGGGVRHKVNKVFSHKAAFAYGRFVADEEEETRLSYRGYAYDVQLYQLWWQPELTFFRTKNSGTYLFSGIGIVHSSSRMTGSSIRSEDRFKERETAALMPFGVGYEAALSKRFSLGAEIVCYYYFSDFIDGISTKFSSSNDVAGAVLFSFSYKIYDGNGSSSRAGLHKKRYRCFW